MYFKGSGKSVGADIDYRLAAVPNRLRGCGKHMRHTITRFKEHIYSLPDRTVRLLTYAAFFIISFLFMYSFSLWISPRYKNWYGCDASFFTLVGRGMLKGMVPYTDFYDLKGPYFFFIQALGQLIRKGHTGLFILEILSLFASLILIYNIGTMYISKKKTLGVIVFFLLAYISMLWGGNCLEEFCLPLNLLVIWLNLKCFTFDGHNNGLYLTSFITGICFTLMTFSKITAGSPLIGLVAGVFILLLIHKEFRQLGYYILYLTMGAMIAFLPLLIYYGYHNSILKMLYCTFIFGFNRSRDLSHAVSADLEVKLSGVSFSIVFTLLHMFKGNCSTGVSHTDTPDCEPDKISVQSTTEISDGAGKGSNKERNTSDTRLPHNISILLLPMSVVTYLALHLGDSFIYYFITGMPCMLLSLIFFLKLYDPLILFKNFRQSLCWLFIFIFVFHYTGESIGTVKLFLNRSDEEFQSNYYRNSKNMGLLIPENDRDSVFSFDIDMQWYEINDILPCNKYMVNLQYFIALEPSIEQELFDFMENTPPKWMICSNTLPDYLPQMDEIVRRKYDCIYSTDVGLVYLLRE